jgi:hypothetical protein
MSSPIPSLPRTSAAPDWLEIVRAKVESLNYGIVQIVVHDHKVTQIEKTEKTRLDAPKATSQRGSDND